MTTPQCPHPRPTDPEPWKRLEVQICNSWVECSNGTAILNPDLTFRIKPTTVNIGGVEAVKTCGKADSKLAAPTDTLRAQLAEAQRELQNCKYGRAISVDDFIATFRCEDKGIVSTTNAKIHSVSQHDDGVIEVVIDHWP